MVVLADGMATARRTTTPAPKPPTIMQGIINNANKQAGYVQQTTPPNIVPRYVPPVQAKPYVAPKPVYNDVKPKQNNNVKPQQNAPLTSNSVGSGGGSGSARNTGGGGSSGGGGGGGGSVGGGGGGGAGVSAASFAAPAPVMENITIPDAQADENYQRTVGDLARARADFTAQQGLARSQYDFGWNDAKRRMGWDDTAGKFDRSRPGAYGESVTADEGDFAGRGMLHSGLYLNSLGDIDRDFGDRKSSLDTARNDNVNTQSQALSTFSGSQDATKQSALTDAVSRIASKYGIDLGAVPKGTGPTTIQRHVV